MIFANKTPIEGDSIKQFNTVLELPGIIEGAGFPDLHPGRGVPVGAAFKSKDYIYPHLIGNDIGCGMALFKLDLPVRKFKVDKIMRKFTGDIEEFIQETARSFDDSNFEKYHSALGTIGHGNHFIEFLSIEHTYNETEKDSNVYLIVHCGSRGYGEILWRKVSSKHGNKGLIANEADGIEYLKESDFLIQWAKYNRKLVAKAMAEILRCDLELVTDSTHNGIFAVGDCFIHRKGATEVKGSIPVVVAGSRGTNSYLIKGLDKEGTLSTLAHGCGRKWQRGDARSRLKDRYRKEELQKTSIGSWVICPDKDTLYEEAPEAYKNIDVIMDDLESLELAIPLICFKPLLNIKP